MHPHTPTPHDPIIHAELCRIFIQHSILTYAPIFVFPSFWSNPNLPLLWQASSAFHNSSFFWKVNFTIWSLESSRLSCLPRSQYRSVKPSFATPLVWFWCGHKSMSHQFSILIDGTTRHHLLEGGLTNQNPNFTFGWLSWNAKDSLSKWSESLSTSFCSSLNCILTFFFVILCFFCYEVCLYMFTWHVFFFSLFLYVQWWVGDVIMM